MTIFSLPDSHLRQRRSLKWRTYAEDVLPLWVAEMDAEMQPSVRTALDAAFDRGDTGYPFGTDYQDAFAAMAAERWNWTVDPAQQVRRGGDVMNSILCVIEAVTDPGDGIVINPPVYPPIRQVAGGYRRHVVESPLTPDGRLDLADLERVFDTQRPKAYLLCSPHNPTGTIHTADELSAVAALCTQYGVTLIADEIHACLVDPESTFTPLLSVPGAERAVVATSAGKSWNLAGFKAGLFVVGSERLDLFGMLPPLAFQSTGFVGQIAHSTAIEHEQAWVDQARAELSAHKDLLIDLLHALVPLARYERAPGTYLAWVDCRELGLEDPAGTFLKRGRVAFNPGANFGPEHQQWVRINLATSPAMIKAAVERMATALRSGA